MLELLEENNKLLIVYIRCHKSIICGTDQIDELLTWDLMFYQVAIKRGREYEIRIYFSRIDL